MSIAHVALTGPKLEAVLEVTDPNTLETSIGGEPPQVTVFPDLDEAYALRQELAVAGDDSLFADALGLANLMRGRP
jgi:hypothetical protein